MLNIDCLVKNTDFIDGVKKYVKYIANHFVETGENASFENVYKHLKENNLEVDIETAGVIYNSELPTETDDNFTSREDVEHIAGRQMDETFRNLLLGRDKTGEKTIGDLSPRQAIVKKLSDAFNNNVVQDKTTKSVLRTIQDMYVKSMDRITGELPNKEEVAPDRTFEQIAQEGFDKMGVGYRDNETGLINNLHTLHEGVKKELKEFTDKLEAEGDPVKAEQFKKYVADFQQATYDIALDKGEARELVDKALISEGYGKTDKEGKLSVDYNKLAGEVSSVQQLRDNVINALTKGDKFDKTMAEVVANHLQRQFVETIERNLAHLDKEQSKKIASYDPKSGQAPKIPIDEVVADQVKRWGTYTKHADREGEDLVLSKKTAGDALKHVMIESGLSREMEPGKSTLDIDKVSNAISSPADIKQIATDYFEGQKKSDGNPRYDKDTVGRLANAIDGMYQEMFNKVREHVEGKQRAIENTWAPTPEEEKVKPSIGDAISARLKEWSQYKKITGKNDAPLQFTKNEGQRIVGEVLKNSNEYGLEAKSGNKTIGWQKLAENPPTEEGLREMIQNHVLKEVGATELNSKNVATSLARDYHAELQQAIKDHAESILKQKEKALEIEKPERKTAIHRLAELTSLGLFDKGHEKLMYHFLGVDEAHQQDLESLKEIAHLATDLRAELSNKDYHADFLFKNADRLVNEVIHRNKDNNQRSLSIVRAINHTFELMNMGLISNPYNMVENNWSGLQALIGTTIQMRKELGISNTPWALVKDAAQGDFFKDKKLWWNVWKDVAIGGVELGGAGDKWSHLGSFADNLNSVNIKKNPIKALKTMAIIIPRAMLNASDAANKAVLAKKNMMFSLHQAMVQNGWSSEAAAHHIHEAIYGQSFEDAQVKAKSLIAKYGDKFGVGKSEYAQKRATIRLANDLVIANLNLNADPNLQSDRPIVDDKMIEAAMGAGFHAAAISLGHEANNPASRALKAGKKDALQRENDFLDRAKDETDPDRKAVLYNQAAKARLINNLWFNGIKRMQSGAFNWAKLRGDALGIGLATGYADGHRRRDTKLDFDSKESLEQTMKDRAKSSGNITRGFTGIAATTMGLAGMAAYGFFRQKQEEDDIMQNAADGIKDSYILNRSMNKFGPDLAQLYYLYKTSKGEGVEAAKDATIGYVVNLINANPAFTPQGKLAEAAKIYHRGNVNKSQEAAAQVGSIYGDMVQVPFYKSIKQFYQLGNHIATGKEIDNKFTKQKGFLEGMFGGGLIQDAAAEYLDPATLEKLGMEEWIPDEESPATGAGAGGKY